MKFFMPFACAALLLVGCDRIDGQLNITKDFSLVNSSGKSHELSVGTYTADLRQSLFGKKIVLRLNNDSNEKFNFTIPSGKSLPDNGTFKLTSSQIGQNVDLAGTVKTVSTDSQANESYQSCSYTEPYTVCQPTGPRGQVICSTYIRTVLGTQWVRYFDRTSTQDILLSISAVKEASESAQFTGSASWTQRIIVNQSLCR